MEKEKEDFPERKMYLLALQDICARIDLAVGTMLNAVTEMNNAKNHYIKVLGKIREREEDSNDMT